MRYHRPATAGLRPLHACAASFLALGIALSGCASGGASQGQAPVGLDTDEVSVRNAPTSRGSIDMPPDASVHEGSVPASRDRVWAVLPSVVEEDLGVEVGTLVTSQNAIGNQQFNPTRIEGRRLSTYLDCGRSLGGPNADRYRVTAYFLVRLADAADGGTTVTTVIDGYARPRNVAGESVRCRSLGTLERRVAELINARLAGP